MKRPLSMTGFGRGEAGTADRRWIVEIRSVNHKFSDVKIKIPRTYIALEDRIKKELSTLFSRGHIEVMVTLSGSQAEGLTMTANLPMAHAYHASLLSIQKELGLIGAPDLKSILECKDIITLAEVEEDVDLAWAELSVALTNAIDASLQMREAEGLSLKKDLVERIESFTATIQAIEERIPELIVQRTTTLKERLNTLLDAVNMDPMRLAQEVAILADKSDVTEELVRLKSHIQQFRSFLESDEPVGRRLDFLLQEFLREINTMASKINDASIAHMTVDLKNEVEKIREQAANIE